MPRKAMSKKRSAEIAERLTTTEDLRNFPTFARQYLKIMNRPETSMYGRIGQTVPFKLNPVQQDFYNRIMETRKAGKPGRFIVLKARRMGLSTITQALMFHECLVNRNRQAFITAVDRISTNNIFQMAKKMYDNLPSKGVGRIEKVEKAEGQEAASLVATVDEEDLRPELRRNNDNELWLTHPLDETMGLNSKFEVTVADSVHSTRGFEIHCFHGSEIAFWGDPETFMLGLMQTISDDPETLVVLESTANGSGGYFYREFMKAWEGNEDSDWQAVFYPWWQMPNYKRALPEDVTPEALLKRVDQALLDMVSDYDLSPEQTYWAQRTWADKCQGDWDLFKQEYPGSVKDAFSFAAARVFIEKDISLIESSSVRSPTFRGDIVDVGEGSAELQIAAAGSMEPKLSDDFNGALWVWEHPEEGVEYIVSVDPSAGKSVGDWTAMQVIRVDNRKQVAEFQGTLEPLKTAEKSVVLSRHYNDAMLTWEVNGVGHAVSLGIMQSEYWNLYQREQIESTTFDSRYGWSTTVATKPMMVAVGSNIVSDQMPVIRSERLIEEMRSFMELTKRRSNSVALVSGDENYKRVKVGAPPGEHDDLVMSWLQAQAVCELERSYASQGDVIRSRDPHSDWTKWGDGADTPAVSSEKPLGSGWL
mgnify:FL=1|tara:strand:- start:7767 stop:9707 length:1941 start_codon:yes stop_codon:yes gene_type:complete